jgi:hypothetical protein
MRIAWQYWRVCDPVPVPVRRAVSPLHESIGTRALPSRVPPRRMRGKPHIVRPERPATHVTRAIMGHECPLLTYVSGRGRRSHQVRSRAQLAAKTPPDGDAPFRRPEERRRSERPGNWGGAVVCGWREKGEKERARCTHQKPTALRSADRVDRGESPTGIAGSRGQPLKKLQPGRGRPLRPCASFHQCWSQAKLVSIWR